MTLPNFTHTRLSQKNLIYLFLAFVALQSCATKKPLTDFSQYKTPSAPDYSDLRYWAAHADKKDPSDSIPKGSNLTNEETSAEVDVFFVHPTTLTDRRNNLVWNADLNDEKLNKKTDNGSILYQASVFNGAARIYAPRYRQAHILSFFTDDKASSKQAFDLAYSDVKAAFEYYLKNLNNGRPIIIASHSQGTLHAGRLLKEFFDNKPLKNRLVVAYIVGLPIKKNQFETIPLCENPEQTGCFCSWRTFKKDYEPQATFPMSDDIGVVNPLTWTNQREVADKSLQKGAVITGFSALPPNMFGSQIHKGLLWIDKPQFRGSFLFRTPNYHIGDYNLFYFNIREDVKRRIGLFWKR